jgi:hypothetical protein
LDDLPILDVHPSLAEGVDRDSGCDEDDGYAGAWKDYRSSETLPRVQAFYAQAAQADGWSPEGAPGCFSKTINGATAYLQLSFSPRTEAAPGNDYALLVTADHGGGTRC